MFNSCKQTKKALCDLFQFKRVTLTEREFAILRPKNNIFEKGLKILQNAFAKIFLNIFTHLKRQQDKSANFKLDAKSMHPTGCTPYFW
jgi:hypothetical protein